MEGKTDIVGVPFFPIEAKGEKKSYKNPVIQRQIDFFMSLPEGGVATYIFEKLYESNIHVHPLVYEELTNKVACDLYERTMSNLFKTAPTKNAIVSFISDQNYLHIATFTGTNLSYKVINTGLQVENPGSIPDNLAITELLMNFTSEIKGELLIDVTEFMCLLNRSPFI